MMLFQLQMSSRLSSISDYDDDILILFTLDGLLATIAIIYLLLKILVSGEETGLCFS